MTIDMIVKMINAQNIIPINHLKARMALICGVAGAICTKIGARGVPG